MDNKEFDVNSVEENTTSVPEESVEVVSSEEEVVDVVEETTAEQETLVEPVQEEVNEEQVETVVESVPVAPVEMAVPSQPEKTSSSKKSLIDGDDNSYKPNIALLVCATLIATLVIVGALVLYLSSKPSLMFKRVINSAFMQVENNLEAATSKYDSVLTNIKLMVKANSSDEDTQEVLDIFNNLGLEISSGVEFKDNTIYTGFKIDYNKEAMLDAEMFAEGKIAYINEKNFLDRPVFTELSEELSSEDSIDYTAIKDIIAGVRVALNASIKDSYVVKGKDGSLATYTLVIDQSNIKDITTTFLKSLKRNDSFISAMAKLNDEDKDSLIKDIEDAIEEVEKSNVSDMNDSAKIVFYMDGSELKQADVQIVSEDSDTVSMTLKVQDKDVYELTVVSGTSKFVFEMKSSANDDKTEGVVTYKLTVYEDDEKSFDITITADYKVQYNVDITNTLKANAVNIEDLTEEEIEAISERAESNAALNQFIEDINNLVSMVTPSYGYGWEDDYDYDYDWDYDWNYDWDDDYDWDYEYDFDWDYDWDYDV